MLITRTFGCDARNVAALMTFVWNSRSSLVGPHAIGSGPKRPDNEYWDFCADGYTPMVAGFVLTITPATCVAWPLPQVPAVPVIKFVVFMN